MSDQQFITVGGKVIPVGDKQGGGGAAAPLGKASEFDPDDLTLRETEQNPHQVAEYKEWFESDAAGEVPPVSLLDTGEGLAVIDGHHRVLGAQEAGAQVRGVVVGSDEYQAVISEGYDDIELSYALLDIAKEYEAADRLNSQFSGANVAERGGEVADLLNRLRSGG